MSMEAQPALEPCMKVQRIPALTDMREQSLGHGPQCVDAIPLGGEDDVLAFEKRAYLFHIDVPAF